MLSLDVMHIENRYLLKDYNTFGLDIQTDQLIRVRSAEDLDQIISKDFLKEKPYLVLGGGSNLLFTDNFPGLVLKNEILGRDITKEDQDFVWVKLGAGENWHQVVLWAIENDWGGIENLSLIPGTVGAAPMQNIGAYGVELAQVFQSLEAIELEEGNLQVFNGDQCDFGYRYSIFKGELKNKYLITSVTLKLSKKPEFNTSYGAIHNTLQEQGITELSLKAISKAVIAIRESKLPDPRKIGNAGSFFKNPSITKDHFNTIRNEHPTVPGYNLPNNYVKVPAGWLIEQCGWKGKRRGNIGVHKNQALVLVNYGNGHGKDIHKLALDIQASVEQSFNILLTPEVNIVPA